MIKRITRRLYGWLGSGWFFWAVVALFVASAVWIVFTGRYPMAYDEDFHLGIISLYAQQWSPFFAAQPAGADQFGAVVRDPSYLHHYLLSFPYRWADWAFQGREYWTVISLRLFNVAFLAGALVLYRKAILATKASPAVANTVLLFFVLTPVVPYLAAQINYDNLLILFAAGNFWLALKVVQALRQGRLPLATMTVLVSGLMLASLVKYSYLPIAAAITVFIIFMVWRQRQQIAPAKLLWQAWHDFGRRSLVLRAGVAALLAVSAGLFVAMYGYNTAKYLTPAPECDQVIGVERCKAYGAWNRNYNYLQTRQTVEASANPVSFTWSWGATYLNSLFFAVNGSYSGFIAAPPLLVLFSAAVVALFVGLALIIRYARRIFAQPVYALLGFTVLVYMAVLWVQNYGEYVRLGRHVAEQGRYTLVILPAAYLLVIAAVRCLPFLAAKAKAVNRDRLERLQMRKIAAVLGCLVVFTQGGGALTYIVRTNPDWWWHGGTTITVNQNLQKVLGPFQYQYWPHTDPAKRESQ